MNELDRIHLLLRIHFPGPTPRRMATAFYLTLQQRTEPEKGELDISKKICSEGRVT